MIRRRPDQRLGVRHVLRGLKRHDRGQLIAACGTGKTYTGVWVAQGLKARSVLVLVPTLDLVSQTIAAWKVAWRGRMSVLGVCSEEDVLAESNIESMEELHADRVSSDPAEIARFMRTDRAGLSLVVGTYHSSGSVVAAQRLRGVHGFDLAIADEAHHCATATADDSYYAHILDTKKIRAKKRLFMTATPRVYSARAKAKAEDDGFAVASMDDEARFGPVLHEFGFGEAIEQNLLADYRVVFANVTDPEVLAIIRRTSDDKEAVRMAATQVALLKVIKNHGTRRVLLFHRTKNRARGFTEHFGKLLNTLPAEHRPQKALWLRSIDSDMPVSGRKSLLNEFGLLPSDTVGVLSNCRCLGEGVDMPEVDCVVFVDPKQSVIAIAQAVGRAIRYPAWMQEAGRVKTATILLPVFVDEQTEDESALQSSAFEATWKTIGAMRMVDGRTHQSIDQLPQSGGVSGLSIFGAGGKSDDRFVFQDWAGSKFIGPIKARIARICRPPMQITLDLVKQWMMDWHQQTGVWPSADLIARVPKWHGSWAGLNSALRSRLGTSLSRLRRELSGSKSHGPLDLVEIRAAVLEYVRRHGRWPHAGLQDDSGLGIQWPGIDSRLRKSGTSLRETNLKLGCTETRRRMSREETAEAVLQLGDASTPAWLVGHAIKHFGSVRAAKESLDIKTHSRWTREAIIAELRRQGQRVGLPSGLHHAVLREFGTINAGWQSAGVPARRPVADILIAEARSLYAGDRSLISPEWRRLAARWSSQKMRRDDLWRALGVSSPQRRPQFELANLLPEIFRYWTTNGRAPTCRSGRWQIAGEDTTWDSIDHALRRRDSSVAHAVSKHFNEDGTMNAVGEHILAGRIASAAA